MESIYHPCFLGPMILHFPLNPPGLFCCSVLISRQNFTFSRMCMVDPRPNILNPSIPNVFPWVVVIFRQIKEPLHFVLQVIRPQFWEISEIPREQTTAAGADKFFKEFKDDPWSITRIWRSGVLLDP